MVKHNHITTVVKDYGMCPGCDSFHYRGEITLPKKTLVHLIMRASKEGAEYGPLTEKGAWDALEGFI